MPPVFLEEPDAQPDTNHLARTLRPIPLGRKNWLFCWTELGAEHLGIIHSRISTCKLHDINRYTYLVDVLQPISQHTGSEIGESDTKALEHALCGEPVTCADRPVSS